MKKIILLLCVLTMFVFSGCSPSKNPAEETNGTTNPTNTVHEEVSGTISSTDVVHLESKIKTNTECIKITFNSEYAGITVYLFNADDSSVPIQEKELTANVVEFKNLTAATQYTIGLSGEVDTKYEITITD